MYSSLTDGASHFLLASNSQELEARLLQGAWLYLVLTGLVTAYIPAPYGKFSSSSRLPALLTSATLPAPLAWCLQELPSFLISLMAIVSTGPGPRALLLLPFLLHYTNRALLYPLLLNAGSRPVPLLTAGSAFLFTAYNGLMQSQVAVTTLRQFTKNYLFQAVLNLEVASLRPWLSCAGLAVFLLGLGLNVWSDSLLRGLRAGGQGGYRVPQGGPFNLLSCPHYTGECLEWWGYAAVTQVKHPTSYHHPNSKLFVRA